jgi:hypothetical protein
MRNPKTESDEWDAEEESLNVPVVQKPAPQSPKASPTLFTPSGCEVPKSEVQKANEFSDIHAEAKSVTLPDNYPAAMNLYRQVLRMPETNRRERILKRVRRKYVGGHVFKLQLGLPVVADTHLNERYAVQNARLISGPLERKKRLAKLRSEIAAQQK